LNLKGGILHRTNFELDTEEDDELTLVVLVESMLLPLSMKEEETLKVL
jgi:hypothetical protein